MNMNRWRILIVDDSKSLAMLAARKLQQSINCETVLTHNLADTRALLEQVDQGQVEPFFAAVLDLTLPDAPRGEIVDEVVPRGIHSVVLTGTFGEEARESLLAKHVADYVIKKDTHDFEYIARTIERLHKNGSMTALVVDDSISYRSHIVRLLKTQNFRTLEAENGQQALKLLEARAADPSLENDPVRMVITDYMMPELNGLELVTALRERWSDSQLVVIGVSSEDDAVLSARFLKSGASDYLRKPFTSEEFNWRVRQNIERVEQIEALRQSLDTKNKVLGIAAHDLRNPLGGIKGFSQLLMQGQFGSLSEPQKKLVQNIVEASKHMLGLINDLLDVSVIESGKLTLRKSEHDLGLVVADRVENNRLLATAKQIELTTELEQVPHVSFDANRFTQIIDNLITNAIKFSHPGTPVRVRLFRDDGLLRLQVIDQGQGIPAEEQNKLFGHFQRLSSRPTGGEQSTGLGLAIVKRMVEAHGWRIGVVSATGQGSTFEVTIPLS